MKTIIRPLPFIAVSILSCLLASCAGSMDTTAFIPTNAMASSRTGQPILAAVSGGSPSSEVLATVSNEDFKQALETSLVKSKMFRNAGSGGYKVEAFITSIRQPMMGVTMTVEMDVSYTLKKGSSTVMTRSITSRYSAPMSEAFVGAVRVRKATEGAVRESIRQLIVALDGKL